VRVALNLKLEALNSSHTIKMGCRFFGEQKRAGWIGFRPVVTNDRNPLGIGTDPTRTQLHSKCNCHHHSGFPANEGSKNNVTAMGTFPAAENHRFALSLAKREREYNVTGFQQALAREHAKEGISLS